MPQNSSNQKYVILGLLVLLIAGAAFFVLNPRQDPSSNSPVDFTQGNRPEEAISAMDEMGTPVLDSAQEIPQEIIENSMLELNEADRAKFQSFMEISKSGNDNDPRLDKELKSLSPELKKQIKNYYRNLAPERRNERGLASYLIARDIQSVEDLDFLSEVFSEEPCLSMQDCKTLTPNDSHIAGVDDVSLNYPQIAALYQIQKRLESDPKALEDIALKNQYRTTLAKAAGSSVPKIRQMAEEIQKKYSL